MFSSGESRGTIPRIPSDDPRVFAEDLHRLEWGEYLDLAEDWKARTNHRSAAWRGVVLGALVLLPLLVVGWLLQGNTVGY